MSTGQLSDDSVAYLEKKHIKPLLEELFHDVLLHLPESPLEFLLSALDGKTKLRLMVVGPSGSGKRTQSRLIAQRYGAVHVKAHDVFLAAAENGTAEGEVIARCMREDQMVPDDIAAELIIKRLREDDVARNGWVLDGFPATRSQALRLQTVGVSPILLVVLDVPSDVAARRCSGRRIDPITKKVYHLEYIPPPDGVQLQRVSHDDDSLAAVASRWKYFDARKDEIIGCYEPFFVRIDGSRDVNAVFDEMCEQVDSRFVSV